MKLPLWQGGTFIAASVVKCFAFSHLPIVLHLLLPGAAGAKALGRPSWHSYSTAQLQLHL